MFINLQKCAAHYSIIRSKSSALNELIIVYTNCKYAWFHFMFWSSCFQYNHFILHIVWSHFTDSFYSKRPYRMAHAILSCFEFVDYIPFLVLCNWQHFASRNITWLTVLIDSYFKQFCFMSLKGRELGGRARKMIPLLWKRESSLPNAHGLKKYKCLAKWLMFKPVA